MPTLALLSLRPARHSECQRVQHAHRAEAVAKFLHLQSFDVKDQIFASTMGKKSKTVAWKDANKNNNDTSKEDTSSASANNNTVQPTETTQASSQARGGCKGNDNCKGSNDHKGKKKKSNSHTPTTTFQGECKELKDAIFDVSKRGQLDDCAEGIKRVGNHAAATYDCGGDVQQETEEMEELQVPLPKDLPSDASDVQKKMQTECIETASKREERLNIHRCS